MANIVNVYTQSLPAVKFIGKKYGDGDRVDGGFGFAWQQWIENHWFDAIVEAAGGKEKLGELYEDGGASLGLMRLKIDEWFEYWIGMFTPADTVVPEGYSSLDFPASELGICWVKGTEPDIYMKEEMCMRKLEETGIQVNKNEENAFVFFERYHQDRFMAQDEAGSLVLDIGFFLHK